MDEQKQTEMANSYANAQCSCDNQVSGGSNYMQAYGGYYTPGYCPHCAPRCPNCGRPYWG
jgi:hypothetical protein